jgi:hypothetical protein
MSNFKLGDLVVFGRPNGEQTQGIVTKINGKSIKIKQTEVRGQVSERPAGTIWRVAVSLVRHASPQPDQAPATGRSVQTIRAEIEDVERRLQALRTELRLKDAHSGC